MSSSTTLRPQQVEPFSIESAKVLVTGANGFVGKRLVSRLLEAQCKVIGTDLGAEGTFKSEPGYQYSSCDLTTNAATTAAAIEDCDYVCHLAAITRSTKPSEIVSVNYSMTQNIIEACKRVPNAPVLIYVSSIAICGPNKTGVPMKESDPCLPRSCYGKSKLACEELLHSHADEIPISIVRPPIVLGQGDPTGLKLFRSIDDWGVHIMPGMHDPDYSVIHVDDLVSSMIAVTNQGERISKSNREQGVYFAAADEIFTYSMLGESIGRALGRDNVRVIHVPNLVVEAIAFVNDCWAKLTGKARYLARDKLRDAFAGNWDCSNEKLKSDTGFQTAMPFFDRLTETVEWYRRKGWLK